MDKWQALDAFWNSFGLIAYNPQTVPQDAELPYITYESSTSDFDEKIALTARLWYGSTSWEEVSKKAQEIEKAIGGGCGVSYTGGRLWITKARAFAQRLADSENPAIRQIVLQVEVEFQ